MNTFIRDSRDPGKMANDTMLQTIALGYAKVL